jgi:hypothetical protein
VGELPPWGHQFSCYLCSGRMIQLQPNWYNVSSQHQRLANMPMEFSTATSNFLTATRYSVWFVMGILCSSGVDFVKQFTPYAWNLRSAPIFSLIQHHVFVLYAQLIAFSPIFGCALRRAAQPYRSCIIYCYIVKNNSLFSVGPFYVKEFTLFYINGLG